MQMPSQDFQLGRQCRVIDKDSWYFRREGSVYAVGEFICLNMAETGDRVWFRKQDLEVIPLPYIIALYHDTERWTVSVPKEVYDEILQTYFPSEEDDTE